MNLEQFVQMLDREFLSKASGEDEYKNIYEVVKGHYLKNEELVSKDGKYEIMCWHINQNATILNAKSRYHVWIHDIEQDKYFQYRALGPGSLKKTVKNRIKEYKMGIATPNITYHIEPDDLQSDDRENLHLEDEDKVFCTNCGNKIGISLRFCPNCGKENLAKK